MIYRKLPQLFAFIMAAIMVITSLSAFTYVGNENEEATEIETEETSVLNALEEETILELDCKPEESTGTTHEKEDINEGGTTVHEGINVEDIFITYDDAKAGENVIEDGKTFTTKQVIHVYASSEGCGTGLCVCETPIIHLSVSGPTSYYQGTPFESAIIKFFAKCTACDKTIEESYVTRDMICCFQSDLLWSHDHKVTYRGAVATFTITFIPLDSSLNPYLYFSHEFYFLSPEDSIESALINGYVRDDRSDPVDCGDPTCDKPYCYSPTGQFFWVTSEMVTDFNPALRGPQQVKVTFLGITKTLTFQVLHQPVVCPCPEDCCGCPGFCVNLCESDDCCNMACHSCSNCDVECHGCDHTQMDCGCLRICECPVVCDCTTKCDCEPKTECECGLQSCVCNAPTPVKPSDNDTKAENDTGDKTRNTSPKTGDSRLLSVPLYILTSIGALSAILFLRRKNRRKDLI